METIFTNSLNSRINDSNRFIYQFTDKLNLRNPKKISNYYTWRNIKSEYNNNKFKIHDQLGIVMNLIYPMDLILFLIFKVILNTPLRNMKLLQIIS